jgi:2-polyprenyl-3-methyl-5-hydroxy-6-metoxy-1,4-benzoquinol methylase
MDWDPVTHYKDVAVAERYDAERFRRLSGRVFDTLEKHALRQAFEDVPRSLTVLDVPCGTGRLAETLLEEGFCVVGVDVSAAMLEVATRKLGRFGDRFQSKVADVRELARLEPDGYDVALCARVLMHFPVDRQVEFLHSVATLSKGPVVFSQGLSTPYQRWRRRVKKLIGSRAPANYPITESELDVLLKGSGLRERKRVHVARLISEAMFVVAQRGGRVN